MQKIFYIICFFSAIAFCGNKGYGQNICTPIPLPATECFDAYSASSTSMPDCWTFLNSDNGSEYPRLTSKQSHSDSNSLALSSVSQASGFSIAISPEYDISYSSITDAYLSFWVMVSNDYTILEYGTTDSNTTSSDITWMSSIALRNANQWQFVQVQLTDAHASHSHIAFTLRNISNTDTFFCFIDDINIAHCPIPKLESISPTQVQADLGNGDTEADYYLVYGPQGFAHGLLDSQQITRVHVTTNPWVISNLRELTTYDFYTLCNASDSVLLLPRSITTSVAFPAPSCAIPAPDAIRCSRGSWDNPYADSTWFEYDHTSSFATHYIHTDTTNWDSEDYLPIAPYPNDLKYFIRLGNNSMADSAESISYDFLVDTNQFDHLSIRYAAVRLGNLHPTDSIARLMAEVLDSTLAPADSICYIFNLIEGDTNEWSSSEPEAKHPWSTYSIALKNYHGQRITLRITNRDYGYAYLNVKCGKSELQNISCGDTLQPTFLAPEGFNYTWTNSLHQILPTASDRQLQIDQDADTLYYCQLTHKNGCGGFTLSIRNTVMKAKAKFSYIVDTVDCYYSVRLHNESSIIDADSNILPHFDVSGVKWFFGNGDSATCNDTTIVYWNGDYHLSLIATLYNHCFDTIQLDLHLDRPSSIDTIYSYDSICAFAPYLWEGITIADGEMDGPSDTLLANTQHELCEAPQAMWLHVRERGWVESYDTIVVYLCYDSTYTVNEGNSINEPGDYDYILTAASGCDSSLHVHVLFEPCCIDQIEFPNVLTPNNDGLNDLFEIKSLLEQKCYPYNELSIYDRTGRLVYHTININEDTQWWDPAREKVPCGTYFFYFKARKYDNSYAVERKGVIEVLGDK